MKVFENQVQAEIIMLFESELSKRRKQLAEMKQLLGDDAEAVTSAEATLEKWGIEVNKYKALIGYDDLKEVRIGGNGYAYRRRRIRVSALKSGLPGTGTR